MPLPLLNMQFKPDNLKKPSVIVLIIANAVPLFGVLFLGWKVFPILLLFWMENVIVGLFNVIKMLLASPGDTAQQAAKIFMIPFFCVHYGLFTLVHGIFVFVLFGGTAFQDISPSLDTLPQIVRDYQLIWGILALLISHGASFAINYIGKGEYKTTNLGQLMAQPYGRVVILHLTILFGGFLVMALGSPIAGLLLLVVLKMGIDIAAHLMQHNSMRTAKVPNKAGV
jgi:hypothetical protein